jgi:hypothetical protein
LDPSSAFWKPRALAESSMDSGVDTANEELRAALGGGPLPFPERVERGFEAWHRPRKQYVRRVQWLEEIWRLTEDLDLHSGEFRYLTLPGNDLLDIRYLAGQVFMPRELRLKYLGFNTAATPSNPAQAELNSAEFPIKRLDCVDPESQVSPGEFRRVGEPRSIAWKHVRRAGPFHAINLDLCGGFAGREKADGIPNYFTALKVLLQNQRGSDDDFLLFVTTRMDDDNVDTGIRETLHRVAQNIYETCESYASAFGDAWGLPEDSADVQISEATGTSEAFMLGLTQWLVSCGVAEGLKASVRSFMTYRSAPGPGEDDLVSLAIRFKPDPVIEPDSHGLVKPIGAQSTSVERECEQSTAIPGKVRGRVLVDDVLTAQSAEFEKCVEESCELLSAAGYDLDAYRGWVARDSRLEHVDVSTPG